MQQPPNNQPPPYGNQPSGNQPQYGGQPPANQPPPYGAPPQYGNQPPQYGSQQQYGQSPFGGPPLDVQPQEENDKLIAALAYIICPLLGIIVLLTDMKNKPFLKFHAYQSIVFGIAIAIVWFISIPLIFIAVGCITGLVALVAQIFVAYQVYTKGIYKIPFVSDLTYNIFKETPRVP